MEVSKRKVSKMSIISSTRFMSIVSIGLTLFVLGLIIFLHILKTNIEKSKEEEIVYRIELDKGFSKSKELEIKSMLEREDFVKSIELISADSMVIIIENETGDNPISVLGYNPFSTTLKINIKKEYSSEAKIKEAQEKVSKYLPDVRFDYRKELISSMRKSLDKIGLILNILIIIQILISFVQIGNTTKLMIYSKRLSIRTLSLVGASKFFISRPFILKAIFDALLGTILAVLFLGIVLYLQYSFMDFSMISIFELNDIIIIISILLFVALFVAVSSAWVSTRKYIKMDNAKINLI